MAVSSTLFVNQDTPTFTMLPYRRLQLSGCVRQMDISGAPCLKISDGVWSAAGDFLGSHYQ